MYIVLEKVMKLSENRVLKFNKDVSLVLLSVYWSTICPVVSSILIKFGLWLYFSYTRT